VAKSGHVTSSCLLDTEPKLVAPLGRGARGKSTLLKWMVERAQGQGRDVVVADVDRTNPSLSHFFDGVVSPPSADDRDVKEFLVEFIEQQIEKKFTAALDLGGGDLILKQIARETQLVPFLRQHHIMPVAIHVLGTDIDDLNYLHEVEQDEIFAPAATIVVLNEGTVPPHRTAARAFESICLHPILTKVLQRGAKLVRMPRLEPAGDVDRLRLSFAAAEEGLADDGKTVLGPFARQQTAIWRRQMEEAFASVAAWLP
jgi:hypothetical protein